MKNEIPIEGLFDYIGDDLDIKQKPAWYILKEVFKARGYIK